MRKVPGTGTASSGTAISSETAIRPHMRSMRAKIAPRPCLGMGGALFLSLFLGALQGVGVYVDGFARDPVHGALQVDQVAAD